MPEMKVERALEVNASPRQLWDWMAAIENWPHWKPFIVSSSLVSGLPLEKGSKLRFKPKMGPAPINLTVRISESDPPNRLAWSGGGPGLAAVHSFDFEDLGNDHTRIVTREVFKGPAVWLLKLFVSQKNLEKLHEQWLEAFQKKAEEK